MNDDYGNNVAKRPSTVALPGVAAGIVFLLGAGCASDSLIMATYIPSQESVVKAMLELAEVGPEDVVYDLGSGDGRIVIAAARDFGASGVGIERDPELVARSRANARAAGVEDEVRFVAGDIFEADIAEATVVTLFLYHTINLKLRPKLLAELRPGSRVVSQRFDMGDWTPDAERRIDDAVIYLWRIPDRAAQAVDRQAAAFPVGLEREHGP